MANNETRILETTALPQLVQEAITLALRLGFGQQPTQTPKKAVLIYLDGIPALAESGFWVD